MYSYTREALRLANEVRRALGLAPARSLQPGRRGFEESCPIATTIRERCERIRCAVDGERVSVWVGAALGGPDHMFTVPGPAAVFIEQFDAGLYRWLEVRA